MLPTLRRLAQRAFALTLSLLVALTVIEIALRVGFPAQTKFYVWPPRATRVVHPEPTNMPGVSGAAHFTVSSIGIRGPELGAGPEHRILAVGGSTTECLYLDDAETWPSLLASALGKTPDGRPTWVGNVGKAGLYSRDHVVHLEHFAPQLPRIDTVTVLLGINDVTHTLALDPWAAEAPITDPAANQQQIRRAFSIAPGRLQEMTTDEIGGESSAAYKRTALFQLVRRARQGLASRTGLAQDEFGAVYATWRRHRRIARTIRDRVPDLTQPLADYRRNLEIMADLAASQALRIVFLTQPTLWRADLSKAELDMLWLGGVGSFQMEAGHDYYSARALTETMARFNEITLDVCRARGLACFDLAAKIPKDLTMFYDDCHFTEAGSRAVAEAVAAHLRTLPPFAVR